MDIINSLASALLFRGVDNFLEVGGLKTTRAREIFAVPCPLLHDHIMFAKKSGGNIQLVWEHNMAGYCKNNFFYSD